MSASTTQTQTPRRLRTSTKIESHSLISCISNQSIPYDRIQTNIPSIKQSYTKKRRIQQPINTTSIQQEPICKGIVISFIKNYPKNSTTPSVDDDNFIYLKRKTLPYNPHLQSIMNPLKPKEQRKFIQIEKTSFTVEHEKRRDTSSLADVELKIPPTAYKTFRNEIQFMNCLNESDSMKLEKEYNLLLKMNKDINKEEVHTNTTSALKLKGKQDKENFSFINGQSETNITFNESISLNLRPQRNQNIPLQRPSLLNMNHNSALNSRSIKKKSYIETRKSVLNDADNVSVLSRSNPFESILKIVLRKKKNDLIKVHANQAETSFSNHLLDKSVDFHSVPNVIHRRIGPDSPKKLAFKDWFFILLIYSIMY